MPTSQPRYTFTDTGELRDMLDRAQRAWPEVVDRKELLVRLARQGEDALEAERQDARARRARQRAALERAHQLVEPGPLLDDAAWR